MKNIKQKVEILLNAFKDIIYECIFLIEFIDNEIGIFNDILYMNYSDNYIFEYIELLKTKVKHIVDIFNPLHEDYYILINFNKELNEL